MKRIKGLLIADLHIGCMNAERQYDEIQSIIFPKIKSVKPDFIIFLGDFFDHKASLNDALSYYSFLVFTKIISICEELNLQTKIRFIYGTESHEWNQYHIIETMKTSLDVKVIRYCEEEELYPDLHVLYIPEEHIYDKGEYYKEYLTQPKKYDYIFGHGVIREVMKEAAITSDNQTSNRKKVPVFSTGELMYACKGQTYFGHYHIHSNMDDEVFYVGSFNRWCFGEEEDKGIYLVEKRDDEYYNKFIINDMSEIYKTISFGYDNIIFKDNEALTKKLDQIDDMIKNKIFDYVRFEFNIPSDAFNPEFIMNVIKERYRFNDNIKTNIVHGYVEEKKKKDKEEIEQWNIENAPIFNKDLHIEDKVSYFIGMEFKREIKPDRVNLYLTHELSEILKEMEDE